MMLNLKKGFFQAPRKQEPCTQQLYQETNRLLKITRITPLLLRQQVKSALHQEVSEFNHPDHVIVKQLIKIMLASMKKLGSSKRRMKNRHIDSARTLRYFRPQYSQLGEGKFPWKLLARAVQPKNFVRLEDLRIKLEDRKYFIELEETSKLANTIRSKYEQNGDKKDSFSNKENRKNTCSKEIVLLLLELIAYMEKFLMSLERSKKNVGGRKFSKNKKIKNPRTDVGKLVQFIG